MFALLRGVNCPQLRSRTRQREQVVKGGRCLHIAHSARYLNGLGSDEYADADVREDFASGLHPHAPQYDFQTKGYFDPSQLVMYKGEMVSSPSRPTPETKDKADTEQLDNYDENESDNVDSTFPHFDTALPLRSYRLDRFDLALSSDNSRTPDVVSYGDVEDDEEPDETSSIKTRTPGRLSVDRLYRLDRFDVAMASDNSRTADMMLYGDDMDEEPEIGVETHESVEVIKPAQTRLYRHDKFDLAFASDNSRTSELMTYGDVDEEPDRTMKSPGLEASTSPDGRPGRSYRHDRFDLALASDNSRTPDLYSYGDDDEEPDRRGWSTAADAAAEVELASDPFALQQSFDYDSTSTRPEAINQPSTSNLGSVQHATGDQPKRGNPYMSEDDYDMAFRTGNTRLEEMSDN